MSGELPGFGVSSNAASRVSRGDPTMQFDRLMGLVVAAVLGLWCSAYGLEVRIEAPESRDATRRAARQQYLDELRGSIQSACDLSEAQVQRLRVASKGAVEYSLAEEASGNEQRVAQQRIVWKLEVGESGKPQWVSGLDAAVAADHRIWTRTIERTLTREQLERAKKLAKQQLDRWTERFAPRPVILRGDKIAAPINEGLDIIFDLPRTP